MVFRPLLLMGESCAQEVDGTLCISCFSWDALSCKKKKSDAIGFANKGNSLQSRVHQQCGLDPEICGCGLFLAVVLPRGYCFLFTSSQPYGATPIFLYIERT